MTTISFRRPTLLHFVGFMTALSAAVSPARAQDSAAASKPKLMVLVEEKNMGIFDTTAWENVSEAETTLTEIFLNKGFQVVDPGTVRRNLEREKALRIIEGDDQAAALFALKHGAQLAVVGKAFSKSAPGKLGNTNLRSIQGVVTARVVATDSGKVLASKSARSAKPHIDEMTGGSLAIKSASKKLADGLIAQVLGTWRKQEQSGAREFTLTVSGLVSFLHLEAVMAFLENDVEGLKKVQQKSYTGGIAEIALEYGGASRDLARALAMHQFTGFRLNPTDVSANKIHAQTLIQKQ